MSAAAYTSGIVLGFDYGERRIGVALGNGLTRSARPLRIIQRSQGQPMSKSWLDIAGVIQEWQPERLVVGVARHPDGAEHEMTQRCERFARQLEGRFGLAVSRVDERYSSAVVGGNEARDDAAAAVILQQWFDENEVRSC